MENILYEKEGEIALIRLNRPETYNAFNADVLRDLEEAFDKAANDADVKAVVLGSTSDKVFSAGADLKSASKLTPEESIDLVKDGQEVFRKIEAFPKPKVAAINALALGGGLEITLVCDARIAAEGAKLGAVEVGVGLIPAWGGTQRLPKTIGKGFAAEMILTGAQVSDKDAASMGLVNKVVPVEKLIEEAKTLALELTKG